MVRWLRVCLPMQGTWVRCLVWEDLTCLGATKPVSHPFRAHMPQSPCRTTRESTTVTTTRESPHRTTETNHGQINKLEKRRGPSEAEVFLASNGARAVVSRSSVCVGGGWGVAGPGFSPGGLSLGPEKRVRGAQSRGPLTRVLMFLARPA